ncbi:MAG: DUF4247 domain-containing protein [Tomitella sp.]|nr:DUF4247 domain-containing protein [Tomitella sp.]
MTPHKHFVLAGVLAVGGVLCFILGVAAFPKIDSHIADNYQKMQSTSRGADYECQGDPQKVADDLAGYRKPQARKSDKGTEYMRYDDDIVTVGPSAGSPCTIHVEGLDAGYRGGAFIFLGPGFFPGAPAGGAGGSGGGPGGTK